MKENLLSYIESLKNNSATIASLMDSDTFFEIVRSLYGVEIFNFEELKEQNIFNIFWYGIEEGKKEFSIESVRNANEKIALKPYEGKNIFVFQDFDTAGISAQNSALKIIEDCPEYSVIILIVKNPEKILPTIHSRTISFFEAETEILSAEILTLLNGFFSGKKSDWISYLYNNEFSRNEAKLIMIHSFGKLQKNSQKFGQEILIALETSHENPKLLLETFFLTADFL